ncbi:hypothetical protein CVT26_013836 [Gymnopilus dilepis]|uniref:Uncharacterized protein n=1 Tax=Gymnopilus dilepis TaxID=231916 RepID=A0A409VVZ4_9AGAR|nr:hypothetical protein CVT26_013836 [Gymnopilus dilepis]
MPIKKVQRHTSQSEVERIYWAGITIDDDVDEYVVDAISCMTSSGKPTSAGRTMYRLASESRRAARSGCDEDSKDLELPQATTWTSELESWPKTSPDEPDFNYIDVDSGWPRRG